MGGGVHHQVGQRALDRVGAHHRHQPRIGVELDLRARTARALADLGQQRGQRRRLGVLARLPASEGQVLVDHVLHLGHVAAHGADAFARPGQRQFQLEAREGGAQVVADRGQERRALVDVALDAALHSDEGVGRLAHLGGPVRTEVGHVDPAPERFGGGRQALDGAHLVPDEQHGHRREQQGGPRQPHDEGPGLGGHGPVAGRQHPQHPVRELDTDVDVGGVAGGVEPDRPVQALGQGPAEGAVHLSGEEGPPGLGGQRLAGLEGQGQVHVALGLLLQAHEVDCAGIGLVALGQIGDVAGEAVGQAVGHRLPVRVEEGPGHRRLHQGDRQDDDQQGAAEQGARHQALQLARPEHAPDAPQARGGHQSGASM